MRRSTKLTINVTLIIPVGIYGPKVWTWRVKDERAIAVPCFRIEGAANDLRWSKEWRRRMKHELHALLEESTMKIGRNRWVGHVARIDENQPI